MYRTPLRVSGTVIEHCFVRRCVRQGLLVLGDTGIFHLKTAVLNRIGIPLENQRAAFSMSLLVFFFFKFTILIFSSANKHS